MKKPLREYLADLTEYVNVNRILRIGRRATKKAQEDNRRMGIPNVYSINGQLYYELPNGELTTEDPMAGQSPDDETPVDDGDTRDADADGEMTAADNTPEESSTESNDSATETTEAVEDTIQAPATSRLGKNGAVIKPKSPAAFSDPAADVDE